MPLAATEAIMFCRGGNLEDQEAYDREKLINWLFAMLPSLINKDRLTIKTRASALETHAGKVKFLKLQESQDPFLVQQRQFKEFHETVATSKNYPRFNRRLRQQYTSLTLSKNEES